MSAHFRNWCWRRFDITWYAKTAPSMSRGPRLAVLKPVGVVHLASVRMTRIGRLVVLTDHPSKRPQEAEEMQFDV